jgi:hypothetical protein
MTENSTRLQELLKTLTAQQLRFVSARVDCRYDYEAAEAIGLRREAPSRWDNKEDVDEVVHLMLQDGVMVAREILRRSTAKAAQEIADELEHRSVAVRHKAAKDILDRNIGNAPAKHEVTGRDGGPVEMSLSDWREQRKKRRSQAQDTLDIFDE